MNETAQRQDKWIRRLLTAVAVVVVASLGLAVLAFPIIVSGSDAANATKDSTDISSCRSVYSVLTTKATASLDDASRQVDLLTNEALQAAFLHDQATIDRDLPLLTSARELVAERSRERDEAVAQYEAAAKRSAEDPAEFLDECRKHPPL